MQSTTSTPPDLEALDDAQLLRRYVERHDQRAFTALYRRWHTRLLTFVTRKVSNRDAAEDIVMESWRKVHEHAHRFHFDDEDARFSSWIYTIAGNLAKNQLRNYQRSRLVLFRAITHNWEEGDRPLEWEDHTAAPDREAQKRELRSLVLDAIAKLKPGHRVVFVLRELEGKDYETISQMTGVKLGTVKSRLSRARDNFRESMRRALPRADLDKLELPGAFRDDDVPDGPEAADAGERVAA